jgi:hypothetical protein
VRGAPPGFGVRNLVSHLPPLSVAAGLKPDSRPIFILLLYPAVILLLWVLLGDKLTELAERQEEVRGSRSLWPVFWFFLILYLVLLWIATHGFRVNPLRS